jgi:endo-1,3-1,4-beta-glycanase ExoK
MTANLPPQLRQAWTRAKQLARQAWTRVRAASVNVWARIQLASQAAWAWMRKVAAKGLSIALAGWISFRDSWTKQDWFAGIKPLPAGYTGNLTAIGIVTALVFTSLLYGEYRDRAIEAARAIASGEHPSQKRELPPPAAEPAPAPEPTPEAKPVPEPSTPRAAPAPSAAPALPQMGEAFVEHFSGDDIDGRWFISDGWSNGDWMDNDWRADQLATGGDGLRMTLGPGPEDSKKPLASGELRTLQPFRYGYFEVRMKIPRDPGIVTGVFSYAQQDGATRPNEIDIEILGRDTRILETTIHENGKSTHKKIRLPFDSADGFHTYGFDWRPNAVRWYADGKLVHEVVGGAASRVNRPQQFFINLWGSSMLKDWVGRLDNTKGPWTLDVSCTAYAPTYSGKSLCDG